MKKDFDWEKGYYIGQEYIEDPESIDVIIKYSIKIPVKFDNFDIDLPNNIHMRQGNGLLYVSITRKISKNLYSDLVDGLDRTIENQDLESAEKYIYAGNCIVGYVRNSLPYVLDEIYKKKYLEGHILTHAISLTDIFDIGVLNSKGEGAVISTWPVPIPSFPPAKFLAEEADAIFIRDYIESVTNYFSFNIDESIRRIITSLENFWINYDLKKPKKSFKELINLYIKEENYPYKEQYLKILRENISFIYDLRNSVVHNKLRLKTTDFPIAKKAIGTLSYIYQGKPISVIHFNYILLLLQQFACIDNQCNGIDLDLFTELEKYSQKQNKDSIIRTKDDLDDYMFNSLKISDTEKEKYNIKE